MSLHDTDARPIATGRIGCPVEFGFKAQVVDNADGIALDHIVIIGNPTDAPMLVPAVARIEARFARPPRAVTADRGYGEAAVDGGLGGLGVKGSSSPARAGPARPADQRSSVEASASW